MVVAKPVASIDFRPSVPVASVPVDGTGFLAVVELPVAGPVALVVRAAYIVRVVFAAVW